MTETNTATALRIAKGAAVRFTTSGSKGPSETRDGTLQADISEAHKGRVPVSHGDKTYFPFSKQVQPAG